MTKSSISKTIEEKSYQSSFNNLKKLINEAQKIEISTSFFQFLDQVSADSDSPTHRKEVIKNEYPNLTAFQNSFSNELLDFNNLLKEQYNGSKPKESKQVGVELDKALDRISNSYDSEKVKVKIRGCFTDENRYKQADHLGVKMLEARPYVWQEFTPDLLDKDYLFDDYIGFLYSMLNAIGSIVEDFKTGYKKSLKIKTTQIDLSKKPSYILQDEITERWNDFEQICKYYSEERTFKSGVDDTAINHIKSKNEFHWEGIDSSSIPPLAQFVNALKKDGFFAYPLRKRGDICNSFLAFFHLPSGREKAKYLSKEMSNTKNRYIGFFTTKVS